MKLMDLIKDPPHQKCSMWLNVGIPYMVKLGKWNELEDWEKTEFVNGVKMGVWNKKGERLETLEDNKK